MKVTNFIKNYPVYNLDKKLATKYSTEIATLANLIPLVNYEEKDILAESKDDRIFYGKWEHSLIVFDDKKPIAIIIAYERGKEKNLQYPENSIYISELAVDKNYQGKGIAKKLLELFFKLNTNFSHLTGPLLFTIQTNSASWNKFVLDLYHSFGFKEFATKEYSNRTDVILRLQK